jgi:hypothetical protein
MARMLSGSIHAYVGKLEDYLMFLQQMLDQLSRELPADRSTRSLKIAGDIAAAHRFCTQIRSQQKSLRGTLEEIAGEAAMGAQGGS